MQILRIYQHMHIVQVLNREDQVTDQIAPRLGGRCYATALRKASRRMSQFYDAALEPSGIKTTQRAILATVEREGPLSVGRLAASLVMDPGGLAHTLKPLVRDGFLVVGPDPADKRGRLIRLTAAGTDRLRASDEMFKVAQARFEEAFGHEEASTLRTALKFITSDAFMLALESDPPVS